jgi:hypothetical protein
MPHSAALMAVILQSFREIEGSFFLLKACKARNTAGQKSCILHKKMIESTG